MWLSHSSISDFLKCPRAYYLKQIYKDPKTGRKISLINPPLALGQAVHEVIDSLSLLKAEDRFKESLVHKLEQVWEKITGKKGGFKSVKEESLFKQRGQDMLNNLTKNPGPLQNLAIKIKTDFIPHFYLSESDDIILSGKIDWLEYLPESKSVHIIDFKTGVRDEPEDSLQLPIYRLLAEKTQKYPVKKISYWYLDRHVAPKAMPLPNPKTSLAKILKIAKKVKLARSLNRFLCPQHGCSACRPLEAIIAGRAQQVSISDYQDIYAY